MHTIILRGRGGLCLQSLLATFPYSNIVAHILSLGMVLIECLIRQQKTGAVSNAFLRVGTTGVIKYASHEATNIRLFFLFCETWCCNRAVLDETVVIGVDQRPMKVDSVVVCVASSFFREDCMFFAAVYVRV